MSDKDKEALRKYTDAIQKGDEDDIRSTGDAVNKRAEAHPNPDERRR